jgi:hypothetical protein
VLFCADNAWIETTCANFHDETGQLTQRLVLQAGDDAAHVDWFMAHSGLALFASHKELLRICCQRHGAYF